MSDPSYFYRLQKSRGYPFASIFNKVNKHCRLQSYRYWLFLFLNLRLKYIFEFEKLYRTSLKEKPM